MRLFDAFLSQSVVEFVLLFRFGIVSFSAICSFSLSSTFAEYAAADDAGCLD
jgi:hypothetical protein